MFNHFFGFEYKRGMMTTRDEIELLFGTQRMKKRVMHTIRRAEKKERKLMKRKLTRNVRPFVRLTPSEPIPWSRCEKLPLSLVVQIGDDLQTYEPEAVMYAQERAEMADLFMDVFGNDDFGDEI